MTTQLAQADGGQVVAAPQATNLLEAISRAASDPNTNMDNMERLFAMHQQMVKQQAETAFNEALALSQSEMTTVVRNKTNEFTRSKYADLDTIINWIAPVYTRHGFSVSFNTRESENKDILRVLATLSHAGGHSREYSLDAPLDEAGSGGKITKTKIQATGSTNSYARRYLICMIFNVTAADDNDGNTKQSMYAENVPPARRPAIQKVASEMLAFLRNNEVADAVAAGHNAGFSTEEKAFLWTFFDSKQRSAMSKVADTKRKVSIISDGQKKRLEALIGEFSLKRDNVKEYVKDQYGKDHFAELTNEEYDDLCLTLEKMAESE